jgi:hypothetical protein
VHEGETVTLYYEGETLVASEQPGLTQVFRDDRAVLQAIDTTGDGTPDTFLTLDTEANITDVTGVGADQFTDPEPADFDELLAEAGGGSAAAEEDLVGPLDSIDIPKSGGFPWWIILLLLIGGGGYWFYRKKNRT